MEVYTEDNSEEIVEEPVAKKPKKAIIITVILILFLIVAGVITWFVVTNMDKNSPEEVLNAYVEYLKNADYEGMYSLVSDSTKSKVDLNTYLERNKNIYEGIEASNFEISNVSVETNKSDEKYTASYTLSFDTVATRLSYNYTMDFDRQDENKYYINWNSKLIFPGLEDSYKIRVYSTSGLRGDILDRDGRTLATNGTDGKRVYPYGEVAAHIVGYISSINQEELESNRGEGYTENSLIGKTGFEMVFEDKLRGKNGKGIYIVDKNENILETIAETPVEDGQDVRTTLDIELQQKIFDEFKGDNGFSIAMNPQTGEVLAMCSFPSYDVNKFITGFTDEEWTALGNDANTPMYARYEGTWAPGSSFKPITGAIGLDTYSFSAEENFGTSGLSWQNDPSWGDYHVTTLTPYAGVANLRNALIYSDNIYFAKAALKIGADKFAERLDKLLFNKTIDFPINMKQSQYSSYVKFDSEIQLADSGYGQGQVLVNPLHMASIYSAFATGGRMVKPIIEFGAETENLVGDAFTSTTANEIRDDLIQVVENPEGTAHEAMIEGVTLAGKTGTAELKSENEETGKELGWFNCFVVSEDSADQILTINMVENVENKGGSHYLLPKVKNIIQDYLN